MGRPSSKVSWQSARLEKYFIVRIAWVFGLNGKNFIRHFFRYGKPDVRVVNDQDRHADANYAAESRGC